MMHHQARVKEYDTMHIVDNKQKISTKSAVSPVVARWVVENFELGVAPKELGRHLGGVPVVFEILRAALIGLRSHNVLGRPMFRLDGFGRPVTAIPAQSERRRAAERRAA